MPVVHIVCGPIGAGKTTLARRLAEEHGAMRFSLDEWVIQIFGPEAPEPMIMPSFGRSLHDNAALCREVRQRTSSQLFS